VTQTIWILGGGLLGFAVGAAVYLTLNPVLEASTGWVRELQGMLWNFVPALTAAGLALGWAGAGRHRRSESVSKADKDSA
jgi:hypothetical protein